MAKKSNLIHAPFFELGPKAFMFGDAFVELARFADKLCEKYSVDIIVTPQYVDIPRISDTTVNLFVFAQHMDPIHVGRGVGAVLPEVPEGCRRGWCFVEPC